MWLPAMSSQPDLKIVPSTKKPVNKTIGFYGNKDIFSSLWVTPISQTTVFQSIRELSDNPPAILMLGVTLEDRDIKLHEDVQKVLQFCAKKGIDVLFLKEGDYPRTVPWLDRLVIWWETNVGQNQLPKILEVMQKLRQRFESWVFTIDQIEHYKENGEIS